MKVLIFGGAGFVGRHYTEHFLNKKSYVEIVDNIAPLSGGLNPKKWKFISDQVMGGVSSGEVSYSKLNNQNQAYISGNVSTKNNGGFIQIRRSLTDVNLKNTQSIKINASNSVMGGSAYFTFLKNVKTINTKTKQIIELKIIPCVLRVCIK